jgi:hypothetical protein
LHQPITSAEWVIVTYVLVITSLLTSFGRLGDLISTTRLCILGSSFLRWVRSSAGSARASDGCSRVGPYRDWGAP